MTSSEKRITKARYDRVLWSRVCPACREHLVVDVHRRSKGDALDRVEGDALPTESEFAEAVDDRRSAPKVPPLEATESQLSKFPAAPRAAASAPPPAPTPGRYPPLEPGAR